MPSESRALLGLRASFGEVPALAGQSTGPAIVLGRGGDWVAELDVALEVTDCNAPIFAANHQSGHYPGLDVEHVVSVHCQQFPPKGQRRPDTLYHGAKPFKVCPHTDVFWPMPGIGGSGSSALLATVIALNMGFNPVYVAGVHLDETTSFENSEGKRFVHSYKVYRDGWVNLKTQLQGRVLSVSPPGTFLRNLLGGP